MAVVLKTCRSDCEHYIQLCVRTLLYIMFRLDIHSPGYQQLSSGGVSIRTCPHQRCPLSLR
jgi:hypothetical protein